MYFAKPFLKSASYLMQPSVQLPDVYPVLPVILQSRDQYRLCHIYLPDSGDRMAAITINNLYYSFFRVEKTEKRAREVCTKLSQRGYSPVLTKIPKGLAIWTLEPNAQLVSADSITSSASVSTDQALTYRLLVSGSQYSFCNIRVPDLKKQLTAIAFENRYYSLFKTVDDIPQAVQIVKKFSHRGSETVITQNAKGYGLWVLEPDAYLD